MNITFTRFSPPRGLRLFPILFLTACGGGGGGGGTSSTPDPGPTPDPDPVTVTLTVTPQIANYGESVMALWEAFGANSCMGEGPGFAGPKPTSGDQSIASLTANATIALSCNGAGGSARKTVLVSVNPPYINLDKCTPTSEPPREGIPSAYTQFCGDRFLHVRALGNVPDRALQLANLQVRMMMPDRHPDIVLALLNSHADTALIADDECLEDLPEYDIGFYGQGRNCENQRGAGAIPTVSDKTNVLCEYTSPGSSYVYSVLIHERAHVIHLAGIQIIYPDFNGRLEDAFNHAKANGLWDAMENDYAMTNPIEYWAEGVTAFYNARNTHLNKVYPGYISTRADLANGDPDLFLLIEEYLPAVDIPLCPSDLP